MMLRVDYDLPWVEIALIDTTNSANRQRLFRQLARALSPEEVLLLALRFLSTHLIFINKFK